jgi:hypothetical protein
MFAVVSEASACLLRRYVDPEHLQLLLEAVEALNAKSTYQQLSDMHTRMLSKQQAYRVADNRDAFYSDTVKVTATGDVHKMFEQLSRATMVGALLQHLSILHLVDTLAMAVMQASDRDLGSVTKFRHVVTLLKLRSTMACTKQVVSQLEARIKLVDGAKMPGLREALTKACAQQAATAAGPFAAYHQQQQQQLEQQPPTPPFHVHGYFRRWQQQKQQVEARVCGGARVRLSLLHLELSKDAQCNLSTLKCREVY